MKAGIWERFDPEAYVASNYRTIGREDRQIIKVLAGYYARLPRTRRAIDVGSGANLYPLMLLAPFADSVEAVDPSPANRTYLTRQLNKPGAEWGGYWDLMVQAESRFASHHQLACLTKVAVQNGSIYELPSARYDLAQMFWVKSRNPDLA